MDTGIQKDPANLCTAKQTAKAACSRFLLPFYFFAVSVHLAHFRTECRAVLKGIARSQHPDA